MSLTFDHSPEGKVEENSSDCTGSLLDTDFVRRCFSGADLARLAVEPLFIGLDRDGTLVPIFAEQSLAVLDERVRLAIDQLTACSKTTVAIVSARSTTRLKQDCFPLRTILAGNYGLEMCFSDGSAHIQKEALAALPQLRRLRQIIAEELESILPVSTDDHVLSLCLHYHFVPESERQVVHLKILELSRQFADLHFRALPTSYEVLPPLAWNKADSLSWIAGKFGFTAESTCFLYIGDSEADEPAFRWCNQSGGISILVNRSKPEGSAAKYRLASTGQVLAFLQYLTSIRE